MKQKALVQRKRLEKDKYPMNPGYFVLQAVILISQLATGDRKVPTVQGKRTKSICGYDKCPVEKPGVINVHIVPHSHDDVGWLKTVDQYYYGSNNSIQAAAVQYIYDTVIVELLKDSRRRFVAVEVAFFWRWWKEQTKAIKTAVKRLVDNGQLEFVGAGWCMNDEATAYYTDIIDQMTIGLKFINDTFGECARPKTVWQIDPFGHSKEQAALFALMDFDGLFLGRIDYQDKTNRKYSKTMEMIWEAGHPGDRTSLFTGILYNNYSPPPGFCFDSYCSDQPIVDDPHSPEYNVKTRVADFIKYVNEAASAYATNNILITMGNDFNYQFAISWYKNLDKLIRYVNKGTSRSGVYAFYSTPGCYLNSLSKANKEWPIKEDDFFPYASDPHAYWTGYFTSRPSFKGNIRSTSGLLQACKQMSAIFSHKSGPSNPLVLLERAEAVAQHHDAVTGTAKQHVTDDYVRRLHEGASSCYHSIAKIYSRILPQEDSTQPVHFRHCHYLNVSQCQITEHEGRFVVNIYNQLSMEESLYIRLPIRGKSYVVLNQEGEEVLSQIVPLGPGVRFIPGRNSTATSDLVFLAERLPALGFRSYYIMESKTVLRKNKAGAQKSSSKFTRVGKYSEDVSINNERISAKFDGETGKLHEIVIDGVAVTLSHSFLYYKGMSGNNSRFKFRASGAYIFRPNGTDADQISEVVKLNVYTGPLVSEVHQVFSPWLTQVVRLYKGAPYLEFDWICGPIPIRDGVGKEVVSRFTTDLHSKSIFFTDSNGRQIVKRKRDFRPTWKLNVTEPTSGNYYPLNSFMYIGDSFGRRIGVVVDRAEGGTSLRDGELELMIHRRLLFDDAFGVGEALNETEFGEGLVVRGTNYLIGNFSSGGTISQHYRQLALKVSKKPVLSFAKTSLSFSQWKTKYKFEFAGLKRSLPANVNLLTFEPWETGKILLRLEHIYQEGEHPSLSKEVTVSLEVVRIVSNLKGKMTELVNKSQGM
ncbi:lysosomal alpha-mannosidase-like isoform X3 [Artemia franciscana]|uniref:lysosomal alpha-mannosidase-like isoform X3 n=1 Tax=Artemia franciscana TaxID=6661 RepID=UPI0032DB95B1